MTRFLERGLSEKQIGLCFPASSRVPGQRIIPRRSVLCEKAGKGLGNVRNSGFRCSR